MNLELGERILALRERTMANFDASNWEEVGLLTGCDDIIDKHPRLLRSLSWGDEDYAGNVLNVLKSIYGRDPTALGVFERYIDRHYPGEAQYISAKPSERKITFSPNVFNLPDAGQDENLVALMMPFSSDFSPVYNAVKNACRANCLTCLRADDMWVENTIIQDIFNLIFRAKVVVVDLSGKNPNVMYETGIAHTLGKHVIPISQSINDIPFDMIHHRALKYLPNAEGFASLQVSLTKKLSQFVEL